MGKKAKYFAHILLVILIIAQCVFLGRLGEARRSAAAAVERIIAQETGDIRSSQRDKLVIILQQLREAEEDAP